jgi:glutamyl/glutaminyl-tRNA synthetase
MPSSPDVLTRFAPSPTGHLHIGGARTALFCWAFAKHYGGHFILRIEDTDQARSSDESARGIMEDMAWLGIEWDEGPELSWKGRTIGGDPRGVGSFFQARRVPIYTKWVMHLVEQGKAYPAFEKSEELEAKRKVAVAAKQTYRYDRAALAEMPDIKDRLKRMETGEPHVVRFFAPREEVVVHDQVLGDVKYAPGEMDDFVIRKADGFPTYHFAVVVDDETMGITHVLRAQEHLNNTPRHVALQKALGFKTPTYGHMPLIFNMDGSKMSKRDKAKVARKTVKDALAKDKALTPQGLAAAMRLDGKLFADFIAAENDSLDVAQAVAAHFKINLPEVEVADFRANGYTPEAICNFVALLGWNPGLKTADGKDLEKFDTKFLSEQFDLKRIGKTNSKFDRAKLLSFNSDAIGAMTEVLFVERWLEFLSEFEPTVHSKVAGLSQEKLLLLARALKPRAKTFRDATRPIGFLFMADNAVDFDPAAVEKNLKAPVPTSPLAGTAGTTTGLELLQGLRGVLADSPSFSPANPQALETAIATFAESKGVKLGTAAQALRVALTGSGVSPALGDTLAILGQASVLTRLDRALAIEAR